MAAVVVTLPRVSLTLRRNFPATSQSGCSLLSNRLLYRPQFRPVRFAVSSVLSSRSQVNQSTKFAEGAKRGNLVPLYECIFSDHLTPVLAYRCLVNENDCDSPSFLFESVDTGVEAATVGRYSVVGANPAIEVLAEENSVTLMHHREGWRTEEQVEDPMIVPRRITQKWTPYYVDDLPQVFCGGWVGYFSYDTVRYTETTLPFSSAPVDDRNLPDIHLGLYDDVLVFDHVEKKIFVIHWVELDRFSSTEEAFNNGMNCLESLLSKVFDVVNPRLPAGSIELNAHNLRSKLEFPYITSEAYKRAIIKAKERILAGEVTQLALSERFERRTFSDPFDVYRTLSIVNPSAFMAYIQVKGYVLVSSGSQILTHVENKRNPVNGSVPRTIRSAGTMQNAAEGKQLLNGHKHCKEHMMLADMANIDVGKVIDERPSTCWAVLQAALPLEAVSGAPKIRAMELIDELEVNRRGLYGGGIGCISFSGDMDISLASRTILFPTGKGCNTLLYYKNQNYQREWVAHIQAGATVVADSDPGDVARECESEAAEVARAIDLAESSFTGKHRLPDIANASMSL